MTRRRSFLAAIIAIGALAASGPGEVGRAQVAEPPNFVVIVTDDQRSDTMEVMPQTTGWFGTGGRRFTNGFATTPLCCPSRASIFTGRYAHNHRVVTNKNTFQLDQETTIQYHLQSSGYRTALLGKYLNRWHRDPPYFDEWAVPTTRSYRANNWNIDGERTYVNDHSTPFLADQAVSFITESANEDSPWLMFITTQASHAPFRPERQYLDARVPRWHPDRSINERDVSDKPRYIRKEERADMARARRIRARQLRTLLSVDDLVDDVFTNLEQMGELDHTYVFFMSDHGYSWGDHRLYGAGSLKNTPYTYSTRIPYFMYDPNSGPAEQDDRLVANIDIAPTLVDLAGIPNPEGPPMDGRSLMSDHRREWLLLEWWKARGRGIPPWRSLRSNDAQYTEYLHDGIVVDREYYDLLKDPHQLENLFGDGRKKNDPDRRSLHRRVWRYSGCFGQSCP